MRTSLPSVRLQMHPSMFDLMMTVLENNADNAPDGEIRRNARNLMDKRMIYTRLYPNDGDGYASVRMYESDATETIWQLLGGSPFRRKAGVSQQGIYPFPGNDDHNRYEQDTETDRYPSL